MNKNKTKTLCTSKNIKMAFLFDLFIVLRMHKLEIQ